jgi:hypothetical protein
VVGKTFIQSESSSSQNINGSCIVKLSHRGRIERPDERTMNSRCFQSRLDKGDVLGRVERAISLQPIESNRNAEQGARMFPFESSSFLTLSFLLPQVSSQLQDLLSEDVSLCAVLDDDSCLRCYRAGNQALVE